MRRQGYSLIELITVVAIICVLLSIIIFGIRYSRKGAARAKAKSDMIALGHSVVSYHDVNKSEEDVNNQWPRSMYNDAIVNMVAIGTLVNPVPWELTEKGYWSRSEPISSKILYERYPCSPQYGDNYDTETLERTTNPVNGTNVVSVDFNSAANQNYACADSSEVSYIGINWTGLDNDFGLNSTAFRDNGFLVIDAQKPSDEVNSASPDGYGLLSNGKSLSAGRKNYVYEGNFLLKMGGSDEKCEPNCSF